MGGDGWDSPDLDRNAVEGGFYTNHYSPEDPRPEVQEWVKKYEAKFGAKPDALATLAYDAAQVLFQAMEQAKSNDPAKVAPMMASGSFKAVSGNIKFDSSHNPVKAAAIIQISGGADKFFTTVAP